MKRIIKKCKSTLQSYLVTQFLNIKRMGGNFLISFFQANCNIFQVLHTLGFKMI